MFSCKEIAFEYCPFDASASFAPESSPDYKEKCREVAYGVCEGAVGDQVNDNGCSISTSDLEDLQDKCVRQVNKMTGGPSDDHFDDDHFNDDHHAKDDDKWHGSGDDGYEYVVITEMPTEKPTRRPSKRPTPHPTKDKWGGWIDDGWYGGDDDFQGIVRTNTPTALPTDEPTQR